MFHWLKRYMPRGLYGRAALILILPIVVVQLLVSISFVQRHYEGVTRQMTEGLAAELNLVAAMAGEDGPEAAKGIGAALGMSVAPAREVPTANARRALDLSGRQVIRVLGEKAPEVVAVDLLSDPRRVTVWMETTAGPLEVGFSRRRVSASNPHQLIVLIAFLSAVMVLVAYVYLRNQLRPITRMAEATSAYGKGRVLPFRPSGATEVRIAGQAFLDMRARIERHVSQRTLMLSGVSHDLRTPLTRMKLALSLMEGEDADVLRRDVAEMERLLDAFLDFARGDQSDGATEEVDPAELVRAVLADAERAGLAVSTGPLEEGPSVPLRSMALRRALDNLIGNALRYGTRARVSLMHRPGRVVFVVEDDGPGIPPDQREEAVRPFTRLDPARNQDRGSGVGLGLSIVADIARGHGGALRLDDSADLGGLRAELEIPV